MSKYCEYCSHSLNDDFDCLSCMHLETRPYADNTVVLKDLFILSPSIVFRKGTPEWLKKEKEAEFHCGIEESGFHAYNCNDCPNKCEEWYQWDKETKND